MHNKTVWFFGILALWPLVACQPVTTPVPTQKMASSASGEKAVPPVCLDYLAQLGLEHLLPDYQARFQAMSASEAEQETKACAQGAATEYPAIKTQPITK